MNLADWFLEKFAEAEGLATHEEKEIETVITDALNALTAAVNNVIAERASNKAALDQAESDRDTAQASLATANQQLADAETQINSLASQLNPPAA